MKNILRKSSFLFVIGIILSMTIPSDIKELNRRLKERKYTTTVQMTLFKDIKLTDTLESKSISIKSYNNHLHYRLENFEIFSNDFYVVVIDHNERTVLVNKSIESSKNKVSESFDPMDFDSIFYDDFTFNVAKSSQRSKTYIVSSGNNDSEIDYINFTFNPVEMIPQKILIKYAKNLTYLLSNIPDKKQKDNGLPILMINYLSFRHNENFNKSDFDFSKILSISKKGQVELRPDYKNYKVFNYLNAKS